MFDLEPRDRTSALALALSLTVFACGSPEAPPAPAPVIVPEPASPAPTEAPAPPIEDPPAAPAAPTAEVVAMAPGGVLALTRSNVELWHQSVDVDVIAYPPAVQEAILHQLRAALRESLDGFETASGDPEYPNSFFGSCNATIALADLVSYACAIDLSIGRGGGDAVQLTRTWEVVGETLRELETDDLLVAGVNLEAMTERYDADPNGPMAITPTGIAFVDFQGETSEVPYAELGTLINRSSILSRVPGALDHASEHTELAEWAAPPETIGVLAEGHPLPIAALLGARAGSTWLFPAQTGAALDVVALAMPDADAARATRLGGTTTTIPWSTPARLGSATLRRATALHVGPHGRPTGATLAAGSVVVMVLGDLAAGASRTGGGQWALVVASETVAGWVPSGALGASATGAIERIEAFVTALRDEQLRTAARPNVHAIRVQNDLVVIAETSPGTTRLGYFMSIDTPTSPPRLTLTHAGTLVDVRRLSTDAGGRTPLLLVAWQLPDATTLLWEAYAMPVGGTEAVAPVLQTTLPLPSAPPRERVTLATSITRHGTFHPLVVRGPGRTETLYTWTNGALVTPATTPPAPE
jgi:hypothetical protein